jgi:uncharacterized phage protein gp47/JayE
VPFSRDSLPALLDRVYANYTSLFKPLDKTPRMSLLKVFSAVDAGIYHQLLGDLEYFSRQIFPDTAEGEILREHWSGRVTPLYAASAAGEIRVTGTPGKPVPAGVVFQAEGGEKYYTEKAYEIGIAGSAAAGVRAQGSGLSTNLAAGNELTIVSAIPQGIDSKAVATGSGITGGTDSETDEEYLTRVLAALRNPSRYGKEGDFAAWALDSSPEVSAAWEFKNFGVFGALLVQVISGNQTDGVRPAGDLGAVKSYLEQNAPPVLFEVRTPEITSLNPAVALPPFEDTAYSREEAERRLKTYLQFAAKPGCTVTAGALRLAVIDGVAITGATVKLNGDAAGSVRTAVLEYPVLGEITWE